MPRLRRTPEQRGDDHVVGAVLGWVKRTGKELKDVADIMGCSRSTLYNRLKNPESITGAEMRKLLLYGVVEMDDIEIYFGRKIIA